MADYIRPIDDHYRSPPETIRALLSVESLPGGMHEFCAGDGILAAAAADILGDENVFASTIGQDTDSKTYFPVTGGSDFLQLDKLIKPNLVSNTPYGRLYGERIGKARAATRIIKHSIDLLTDAGPSAGKLCCLLDIRFMLSEDRNNDDGLFAKYPAARIHAFMDRVTMYPANFEGEITTRGKQAFAWYVWEYPFFRPGYVTPVNTGLNSRKFRHKDDADRFDLKTITSRPKIRQEAAE